MAKKKTQKKKAAKKGNAKGKAKAVPKDDSLAKIKTVKSGGEPQPPAEEVEAAEEAGEPAEEDEV